MKKTKKSIIKKACGKGGIFSFSGTRGVKPTTSNYGLIGVTKNFEFEKNKNFSNKLNLNGLSSLTKKINNSNSTNKKGNAGKGGPFTSYVNSFNAGVKNGNENKEKINNKIKELGNGLKEGTRVGFNSVIAGAKAGYTKGGIPQAIKTGVKSGIFGAELGNRYGVLRQRDKNEKQSIRNQFAKKKIFDQVKKPQFRANIA